MVEKFNEGTVLSFMLLFMYFLFNTFDFVRFCREFYESRIVQLYVTSDICVCSL